MTKQDNAELLEIAKQFLEQVTADLDPYTSKKGVIKVGNNQVTLFTPDYVQFAKYGRGAGKKPPLQFILDWVKSKNIRFENSTDKGTAFAIQASIAKNGTLNYVKNAPNAIEEAINKNLDSFNQQMGEALKVQIQREVNQILSGDNPLKIYTI